MSDNESTPLTFEGERIYARSLSVSGDVSMEGRKKLTRHETFAIVARASVDDVAFKDKKGVATRIHSAGLTDAVIVADELADDVLDSHVEATTGQLQLLSVAGEGRRAARLMLDERQRQLSLGWTIDHDDEHDTEAFALLIEHQLAQVRKVVENSTEYEVPDYLETLEHQLVQVGALAIAGVEHARRRLNEHLEAEARAEAERAAAARAEEDAQAKAAADAMAVHSNEEADKRERREVGEDETSESTDQEHDEEVATV